MALITELIEGYADMTVEQKLEALEKLEQPTVDDTEAKQWKEQFNKMSRNASELTKKNRELEAQLKSKLTDDELETAQKAKELEDLIAERDALKRENAISKTMAQYIGLGYSAELAESTANALYDNDIDTVVANAKTFNEGFEATIRAGVVKSNPVPDGKGAGTKTMTKADIMAIKNSAERQQAIADNAELFVVK